MGGLAEGDGRAAADRWHDTGVRRPPLPQRLCLCFPDCFLMLSDLCGCPGGDDAGVS